MTALYRCGGRPTRSRSSAGAGTPWSPNWASNRAPPCATWSRRSFGRTRHWAARESSATRHRCRPTSPPVPEPAPVPDRRQRTVLVAASRHRFAARVIALAEPLVRGEDGGELIIATTVHDVSALAASVAALRAHRTELGQRGVELPDRGLHLADPGRGSGAAGQRAGRGTAAGGRPGRTARGRPADDDAWSTHRATSPCWFPARNATARCWWRSPVPTTTGRPSNSAPGSAGAPARPCCWPVPSPETAGTPAGCWPMPRSPCSGHWGWRPSRCSIEPHPDALVAAAGGAGLVVVGLTERWRHDGVGRARTALATAGTPADGAGPARAASRRAGRP